MSGVDLVDGTPILDIKPYVPMYDCKPEAVVSDWIAHTRKEYGSRRVLFVEETRRVIEQAIAIDSTSGAVSSRKSVEEREGKDGDREPVDSGVQRNTKLPAQLSFYDDVHELRDAIAQVLANDIRSLQSKRRDVKSRGSHITDVMRSEENESNRTTNSNNNNNTEKSRNSQGSNHRGGCEGKGRNTKTQDKDIGDATTGGRWPDWTSLSPSSDSDAAGTPSSDCSDDDRANRDDDEADALLASPQVDVEDLQLYEVRYNQLVLKYVIEPVEEGSSSSRVLVLQASLLAE